MTVATSKDGGAPLTSAAYQASLEVQKDLLSFVIDATMQIQPAIWWCSNMEDVKDEQSSFHSSQSDEFNASLRPCCNLN